MHAGGLIVLRLGATSKPVYNSRNSSSLSSLFVVDCLIPAGKMSAVCVDNVWHALLRLEYTCGSVTVIAAFSYSSIVTWFLIVRFCCEYYYDTTVIHQP